MSYGPRWVCLLRSCMIARRPVKCMVVDDDHDGALFLGEFLKTLGADVRVVHGAQQAIDLAPHFQPLLVVLDLNMPVMDGFQTCRQLRLQAWPGAAAAVIVAHTGQPVLKAILMAAGFDHLITKGDPPDAIERILAGVRNDAGN